MNEATLWHPVADAASLGGTPLAMRLLGQDLVLWRDERGGVRVFEDRCPHRGTRLSLGRVVAHEGRASLECPYHGWRFAGDGRCVLIASQPGFSPPASHGACVHEAQLALDLVWVRLEPGDTPRPAFAAEDDPQLRKLLCGPYDVETSAGRIVENFLDLSHFGFVHEGWLGARDAAAMPDYRVEPSATGFVASGCRAWQPQSNRLSTGGSWVDYRYELTGPFSAVLTKLPQAQDGYRDEIALFVCPVDEERSRVWFRLAVTDSASSDEELRAFQHTIFTQDQPVLESQRPKRLPLGAGEVHCAADRSSAAYRRFLRERGIRFGALT